ncbi:hypothetical protein [Rhizobium sp. 18065]|uniref:hypothetical protein n=1 Tax=Rhizobium sp. 18065 TaxID=2681411 RepID=UPI00135A024A|nr:hypothetical protein [Rhizobium sp. 18065]
MTDPVRNPEYPPDPAVDRQTLDMAQHAGLDADLGSKVPPRYGAFTVSIMIGILIAMLAGLIWIVL